MSSSRLSGFAALGALALVLSGCSGDQPAATGVDTLKLAVIGDITPSQQAFIDRLNELAEGTVTLQVTDNWKPSGGSGSPEDALAKAVLSGDVDIAWVPVRSLPAIGAKGVDAVEAPLLVRTLDQQRAVALGVPGELITDSLRKLDVAGLALMPGPTQYPISSGAPLVDVADWAGKTITVSAQNPVEAATIAALGATAADGSGTVADVVAGSAQAGTADPADLAPGGATATGPYLTSNVALWPRMSIVLINRDVKNRLTNRQNGFVQGAVVRAQDLAMTAPDVATAVADACKAGTKFGTATPDQLTALTEAVQPVYTALEADPQQAKLLEAIQNAVKRNAGTGAFSVPKACRWVAPK